MVRTLRRFSLDRNLTKWLSKCEGSFQKDKEKNTRIRCYDARAEIKNNGSK